MSAISPAGNLARALVILHGTEGGYVNDPKDPGGETKYGITAATLAAAIKNGLLPAGTTIKNLTLDQAAIVYEPMYWKAAHCGDLAWPLAMFVFDSAVNQGVSAALRLLQKSAGTVQDGVIGNNTLTAIRRANQVELCSLFMADRALRYTGTRNFDVYGRGWLKRLFKTTMEV